MEIRNLELSLSDLEVTFDEIKELIGQQYAGDEVLEHLLDEIPITFGQLEDCIERNKLAPALLKYFLSDIKDFVDTLGDTQRYELLATLIAKGQP